MEGETGYRIRSLLQHMQYIIINTMQDAHVDKPRT
jgi:hypothetical protein